MDGLLIIDKPKGPTSHDVVARVRRAIGERRIGHTGTLDPLASGVLPLVLGRATRLARFLSTGDKSYEAVVRLGVATDTYDAAGVATTAAYEGHLPGRAAIERALDQFRGPLLQRPPHFSAKKIDGRRSHRIARADARGRLSVAAPLAALAPPAPRAPLAPVSVTVYAIDLVSLDDDRVRLRVDCSAGFYVRSLAHDLGTQLGTGAHLADLRRTRSGDATLGEAVPLDVIEGDRQRALKAVLPVAGMLPTLSAVVLTMEGVRRAGHGRDLGPADFEGGVAGRFRTAAMTAAPDPFFVRLLDSAGQLVGIARPVPSSGLLHPSVILM
jgi:tRNA pseudouridine55 synthase